MTRLLRPTFSGPALTSPVLTIPVSRNGDYTIPARAGEGTMLFSPQGVYLETVHVTAEPEGQPEPVAITHK